MPDPDQRLGRKILSLFIKDEPPAHAPAQSATTLPPAGAGPPAPGQASAGATSVGATSVGATSVGATSVGGIDPKFLDHFAAVLEKANAPGPDYFEFREVLRHLQGLNLGEAKQFAAAWASFRAMHPTASVDGLLQTARQYLTALDADRQAFGKSVETALNERVGGLQHEQRQLRADTETLTQQIAELQNRIRANEQRLAKIDREIDEQSQKLTQNRANFEATYAQFVEQINADLTNIQTHLNH